MSLPKINVPMFDEIIPSTKKKIKMKQMQVKEEKILLIAKQSGEDGDILGAIKQVVNNCILDDINIDKLTVVDLEWLFIQLRKLSVNNITTVTYRDLEDNRLYNFNIDLNDIKIIETPDLDNKIMVDDEICIMMKPPSASIYKANFYKNKEADAIIDDMVIECIEKIATSDTVTSAKETKREELIDFLNDLSLETYDKIKAYISSVPRIEYVIKYTNGLGAEKSIVLNTLSDFFTFA